jgi:hypothetical protein
LDKTIVTALLVMAGVISAVFVFNAIFPAITQSSDAIMSMQGRYDERLKSQVEIVYAARSGDDVLLWVKNIGSLRVRTVEACDLFFGTDGNLQRIPYGTGTLHWEYAVENDSEWNPTTTLRINIVGFTPLDSATYVAKFILANGVSDNYLFSWN